MQVGAQGRDEWAVGGVRPCEAAPRRTGTTARSASSAASLVLPTPASPADQHDAAVAVAGGLEPLLEPLQLRLPADQLARHRASLRAAGRRWAKYGMSPQQVRQCRGWQAAAAPVASAAPPTPSKGVIPCSSTSSSAATASAMRRTSRRRPRARPPRATRPDSGVRWIRSYVVQEESGELGTFCIYEGESPEAIRAHAAASVMAADEVVPVARHRRRAPRPGRGRGVIARSPRGLLAVARSAPAGPRRPARHAPQRPPSAGYSLLTDAAGIACIDNPAGGMGIHYVNGALVADGDVSAATPELVVYEPLANGRQRLVAAEYVVFQDAWDAKHDRGARAVRPRVRARRGRQPLRPPAVLRAARLAVEAQPGRHVRRLEPARQLRERLTPRPDLTGRAAPG